MTQRTEINLEVAYDRGRNAWTVAAFGPATNDAGRKVYAAEFTQLDASRVAKALAEFIAAHWNTDGTCEVHTRRLDGTWGDPDTYPRRLDPPKSKG